MGRQFLALSLFVILLAFFVVLTSLSEYDSTKAMPVLSSLEMAFAGKQLEREADKSAAEKAEFDNLRQGDTLDKIKASLNATISDFDARKNRLGTEMYVRMPRRDFERALQASVGLPDDNRALSGMDGPFISTLISLLNAAREERPYRMDILLETETNPAALQNEAPEKIAALMQRVSGYSAALQNAGLPEFLVSAGLSYRGQRDEAEGDFVELVFTRHKSFDPSVGRTVAEIAEVQP